MKWIGATLGLAAGGLGAFFVRRSAETSFSASLPAGPKTTVLLAARRTAPVNPINLTPTASSYNPGPSTSSAQQSAVQRNLDLLNGYRKGLPRLTLDANLSAFALAGSQQYSRDNTPHAHIEAAQAAGTLQAAGFSGSIGENQGTAWGVNELQAVTTILGDMFAEGPGGGHYANIMNRAFTRVGIAIIEVGGTWYLTNDFSS